jgi:hypothetical protein
VQFFLFFSPWKKNSKGQPYRMENRGEMRTILLSTLGVMAVAMSLVALGDYHGYEGPVALEATGAASLPPAMKRRAADEQVAQEAWSPKPLFQKLTMMQQLIKARAIIAKPAVAKQAKRMTKAQRAKVVALVAKRQQAMAARLQAYDSHLKKGDQTMAVKILMQGTKSVNRHRQLKAFRPVHLFGGKFSSQEAVREHKRSSTQELSHLAKLNDEIFGAAPKTSWKIQTADQELASFGALNKKVIGMKKYSHDGADSAAKELAQDAAVNAKVFAKRTEKRVKPQSAGAELKHLKAVDDAVVPKVCFENQMLS